MPALATATGPFSILPAFLGFSWFLLHLRLGFFYTEKILTDCLSILKYLNKSRAFV